MFAKSRFFWASHLAYSCESRQVKDLCLCTDDHHGPLHCQLLDDEGGQEHAGEDERGVDGRQRVRPQALHLKMIKLSGVIPMSAHFDTVPSFLFALLIFFPGAFIIIALQRS